MITCKDLASVMTDTAVYLKIDNKVIEEVDYGKDLKKYGDCIVTKIEYLNCDVIFIHATDPNKTIEELENEQTETLSIHKKPVGKRRNNHLHRRKQTLHETHKRNK
nr:MAG TPA: hypothetical protein [Caudoviricetes sp.]